jgi:GAF domain-containing protein
MSEKISSSFADKSLASAEGGDVLGQWRERLLTYILRGAAIVGFFVLAASAAADFQKGDWLNIVVTAGAYGVLVLINLIRLPYRLRAGIMVFLLFALSMNSLLTSGVRGEGRMFWIIFILLTLMLLGVRAAQITMGITILAISVVGWAVVTQRFTLTEPYDQLNASSWIVGTVVMLLTVVLLALGVTLLQREFQSAQKRETLAMDEVLRDREQLESRVSERTRELALAADIGRSVSQLRNLDTLLPNAVELIRAQFNLYYAQIYLVDASGRILTLRAGTGGVGAELLRRGHRLAVGPGSINGMAAGELKAILVEDTASNSVFRPNPLLPETRAELAVPLLVGERVVGVLDLQSRHPGDLSAENMSVFETLAGQLAIALDNTALFVQTEQARREVEEQTRRLTKTGWQEYLNALERSERIGYLFDQNSLTPFNVPFPQTQAENTVKSPIMITGAPVGMIQLERAGDQPWQPEETDLVTAVVEQASRQLENLRLLAQAESYRTEAEDAARRLTREGWKEYLQSKKERQGYVYDQSEVQPLEKSTLSAAAQPADQPVKAVVQPLEVGGEKVGELAFDGVETLDAASTELVRNVADFLSTHIEELRLTEQTQKALLQTEELYSSSAQVVRSATVDEVLRTVVETTSLRRFDHGSITFFDQPWVDETPESGVIAGVWESPGGNPPTPVGTVTPLRNTPFAQVLRRDGPSIIPDVLIDARLNDQLRSMLQTVGRSLVFYPLIAGEVWFGFLSVAANEPIYMTEEEIRPIQTLVGQAATVMQSIRLLQEAQARAQREQALRQITSAVRGSTNTDTILRTATRELGSVLGRKVKVQLGGINKTSAASDDKLYGDGAPGMSKA